LVFTRALPFWQWSLAPDKKICAAFLLNSKLFLINGIKYLLMLLALNKNLLEMFFENFQRTFSTSYPWTNLVSMLRSPLRMALPQKKIREILLLLLYSHDFVHGNQEDSITMIMEELSVSKKYVHQAFAIQCEIEAKLPLLDKVIAKAAVSYDFQRIPRMERSILRLGAYELLCSPQIPGKVALAESIRLTRKFASPEGATFVNAVLDVIYTDRGAED
jgi:transcription antitermination protein NusB